MSSAISSFIEPLVFADGVITDLVRMIVRTKKDLLMHNIPFFIHLTHVQDWTLPTLQYRRGEYRISVIRIQPVLFLFRISLLICSMNATAGRGRSYPTQKKRNVFTINI